MRMLKGVFFVTLFFTCSSASATTYVINPSGTGDFPTIQAAVDAVISGDTIELEDGIYTGSGNRDINYLGKAITIRSQSGNPTACVVDCEASSLDPHRGFEFASDEDPAAVLEGITVRNGYAWGEEQHTWGGGIRINFASPTIVNCIFENCSSRYGGGICCFYRGGPIISHCLFTACSAWRGGGLYVHEYTATLEDCVFYHNTSDKGGAIVARSTYNMSVTNCLFQENYATNYCGGAIYFNLTSLAQLTGCTFAGNVSYGYGGTICCEENSLPVFVNCTFWGNAADGGPSGVYSGTGSEPVLENTIIAAGLGEGQAVDCYNATVTLSCCDVHGNAGGDWVGCIANQLGINGNIALDPLFCDPYGGNFRLRENSPCAPFSPPNPQCDLIGAWPVGCPSAPPFAIASITDVGNDEGRRVRLRWNRQPNDHPGADTTIAAYTIWRRIDEYVAGAAPSVLGEEPQDYPPGEWDFIKEVPACYEESYSTICETLCDSTASSGICWSVFFVRAEAEFGGQVFFIDTAPDSGYSIDNLAPGPPTNLHYVIPGVLAWDECQAPDFDYFTVYGSSEDHLTGSAQVIAYTSEPGLDISAHPYPFYHVTATDFAGNEGSEISIGGMAAVGENTGPSRLWLEQSRPSPAAGQTSIAFELPAAAQVRLEILDLTGRVVAVPVRRWLEAGRHQEFWDCRDGRGAPVATGVYLCRLDAGGKVLTRRLMVAR